MHYADLIDDCRWIDELKKMRVLQTGLACNLQVVRPSFTGAIILGFIIEDLNLDYNLIKSSLGSPLERPHR